MIPLFLLIKRKYKIIKYPYGRSRCLKGKDSNLTTPGEQLLQQAKKKNEQFTKINYQKNERKKIDQYSSPLGVDGRFTTSLCYHLFRFLYDCATQ